MPDPRNRHETPVTLKLVLMWLLSVFVIGVTVAVMADSYRLWEADASAKLIGFLLALELLAYLTVLLIPTGDSVPLARAIPTVIGAAGLRVVMTLLAARLVAGATTPLKEAWMALYSGLWLVAAIHIALIALLLWLVRGALEMPRAGRRARRAMRERPTPSSAQAEDPQDDVEVDDTGDNQFRQQELLSALMERPDQPVSETPVPAILRDDLEPLAAPPAEPAGVSLPSREPAHEPIETVVEPPEIEQTPVATPVEPAAAPPTAISTPEPPPVEESQVPSWLRPDRDGVDAPTGPEDLPRERPDTSDTEAETLPTYDEPGDSTDHFPAVDVPEPQPAASVATPTPLATTVHDEDTGLEAEADGDVFDHPQPEPETLRQSYLPVHPAVVPHRPASTEDVAQPAPAPPRPDTDDMTVATERPVEGAPAIEAIQPDQPIQAGVPAPEPVAPDPVAPEPVTLEPVTLEPVTPEPVTPEPVTPEPVAPEPVAPEPVTPEPVTPEPVAPEPVAPEPVTPEPVTPEPVTPEPVTPEPAAPEPAQLRISEPQAPAASAGPVQRAALPATVDIAIRGAIAEIAGQEPVETGASSSGRAYALIGMPGLVQQYGAEVPDDFDALLGAMAAGTGAVGAGTPESLIVVGEKGTLVAGVSADCSAVLAVRAEAGVKMGRLRVAAQRVRSVAATLRGAEACPIALPELAGLPTDPEIERQTAQQLGLRAGAFRGRERMLLLMDHLLDAGMVAASAQAAFETGLTAAVYAGIGAIERILIEGADGGLVVGSCGTGGEVLVAVGAETAAKMGAANVTVTKMRDAVRGERQ